MRRILILVMFLTLTVSTAAQPVIDLTDDDEAPLGIQAVVRGTAYIKATNAGEGDGFGTALDLDGDTLVVGAMREDGDQISDNSLFDSGAVYVFVQQDDTWIQQAYLKASNALESHRFGSSVALDGNTLIVGAPNENSDGSNPDDDSLFNSGAAYIFERQGTTWTQTAYLKASDPGERQEFGRSVSLDGDTAVVGTTTSDAVYVFQRQGMNWSQTARVTGNNTEAGDTFGGSLALEGNRLVVGASREDSDGSSPDDNSEINSGAAYVFEREGTIWTQTGYLKASNGDGAIEGEPRNFGDGFGGSVALSGDTIVIGALGEDGNGIDPNDNSLLSSGAAYVFVLEGDTWVEQAYLKASNPSTGEFRGDNFGRVAIDGDNIVISAVGEDGNGTDPNDDNKPNSGAMYLFQREGTTWTQENYRKADNTDAEDRFGWSIDIEGDMVAVGAISEDSAGPGMPRDNSVRNAGAAYIFTIQPDETIERINPANAQALTNTASYTSRFQWRDIGADWYGLYVSSPDYQRVFLNRGFFADEVCDPSGICTTPVDVWIVGSGEFQWWMTYWSEGDGDAFRERWEPAVFTITFPPPNSLGGLTGTASADSSGVTVQWDEAPDALWYQVWVGPDTYDGNIFFDWQNAAEICTSGTCTIEIPGSPPAGNYQLWLQAWNPVGIQDWMQITSFSITP